MDNQYWANRALAQLSTLYPWLRFLIIAASEKQKSVMRRIIYMDSFVDLYNVDNKQHLFMVIYATFATNQYADNKTECYGNITHMFKSCHPLKNYILWYVYDKCKETYGFFEIIPDDNRTLGIASNYPENALKIEEMRCQGPEAGNKMWRVIFSPYQKMDHVVSLVDNLIKGNPENYSLPFPPGLIEDVGSEAHHHINLAPILYAIILLLLLIMLSGAYLLYKMCKQCKGSIGFYFKLSWLFGTNSEEKELDISLINIEKLIYTGQNSRVYFARYRFAETEYRNTVVKMPSRDAFQMRAIIEETRIAAQLWHPRVVEYIGFYRDAFGDVRIVSEFMAGGDLHAHLSRRENEINVGHLFNFICQIAEGMEYLISKRIVHRNLAARNCMLNLEGNAIKIADFGLSRHFNLGANYASSNPVISLPLRWMPIECFDNDGEPLRNCNFNEKTDVWAFGIVIWECFTRGAQPYGSVENFKEFFVRMMECKKENFVISAYNEWLLARPEHCPQILYDQVMLRSWAIEQKDRPTFSSIRAILDEVFDEIMTNCPDVLIKKVV